jgi:hypothetical protein
VIFLEIGCGRGGSAQMWKRYLGPHALIVGIDVNPECKTFEEDQIKIRIGSQSDTSFLENIIAEFGTPDVVLDDGSHQMTDVVETFKFLYWDEFGGGLKREGTFIEVCKGLIDELNAEWTRNALPATEFTHSTLSMHFYDSMAVFERGRRLPHSDVRISGRAAILKGLTR